MPDGCIGNCLLCGKCKDLPVLDSFTAGPQCIKPREGVGVAADIGTTGVVLALLDLSTGKTVARHSFLNPQQALGPDVISRIHAANEGRLEELRRLITEGFASGMDTLCGRKQIKQIVIAGNTAMTYLLLGLPCESLGVFPFKPAYTLESSYELFGCSVTLVPWLAAYVGGDITAGLLHVLPEGKERFLLIDLGTNGEMALYDGGRLTVTSTAAGPAFESGHGGASDTIYELARLMRIGAVDETGLLKGESALSQKQVRDLQLAKSAVRSGLEIILEDAGAAYDTLESLYLAGGIGQAMDINDAVDIGLIPPELRGKARAVGNSSLGGAARLLLSPSRAEEDMQALLSGVTEINLAAHPRFNDLLMENIPTVLPGR